MPSEIFEEKQIFKREHYEEMIVKSKQEIQSLEKQNKEFGDATMGTPILIGHHSEKRHRKALEKVHNRMSKIVELYEKIKHYENKIKNIDNPHAILSDDPEAVMKLKEKLINIESKIAKVKEHNKNCKTIYLAAFGYPTGTKICNTNGNYKEYCFIFNDKTIERKDVIDGVSWEVKRIPDEIRKRIESWIKTGKFNQPELKDEEKKYDSYVLENLNSNKRSVKKRLEEIQQVAEIKDTDETINGVRIFIDKDENRIKIEFGFKPDDSTRTKLKRNGFRWSPRNQAWQSYIHDYQLERAKQIVQEMIKDD